MNDEEPDRRLRSYFSAIEQDESVQQPMPSARHAGNVGRPHQAFRVALVGAAIVAVTAGLVAVRSRTDPHANTTGGSTPITQTAPEDSTGITDQRTTNPPSDTSAVTVSSPPPTFPARDPTPQNYLIVGADNDQCVDPAQPAEDTSPASTTPLGHADTIMIVRIEPANKHLSILSFPPELWVKVYGSDTSNTIGSTFSVSEPSR